MSQPRRRPALAFLVALGLAVPMFGQVQELGPLEAGPALELHATAGPALRLADADRAPDVHLSSAYLHRTDEIEAIAAWNLAGQRPTRNGFFRDFATPLRAALRATADPTSSGPGIVTRTATGELVWSTIVTVDDAWALRLRLSDLHLPARSLFWVYAPDRSEERIFGLETAHMNTAWTPTVFGDTIALELRIPADAPDREWSLTIDRAAELVPLEADGTPATGSEDPSLVTRSHECVVDANCVGSGTFPAISSATRGASKLFYVSQTIGPAVCSGGLLNNTNQDSTPYLLTANHCISRGSEASSLEAFFDATTTSCNGAAIPDNQLPSANGATLLATGTTNDFTLLRLSSVPGGRVFLGWTTSPPGNNASLHRLSHPFPNDAPQPLPQQYSRTVNETNPPFSCTGASVQNFVYSRLVQGGTFGGSSGSPIMLGNGQVVGQLLGACGSNPNDGCDGQNNREVDGRFSRYFNQVSQWLDPNPGSGCPLGLVEDEEYADFCFGVTITQQDGNSFAATHMDRDSCIDETVCFEGAVAGRAEIFVRVVGPKPNGFLWPTLVKFSTSQLTVTIHQLSTGITKVYVLDAVSPGNDALNGQVDRFGFQ